MTSTALYMAFLPILRMAGRWLIRRLATFGASQVMAFIALRIETFKRRLKNAKTKRRKAWLRFRIAWRKKVFSWLANNIRKLQVQAIDSLEKLYDKGLERISWDARGERYSTWLKDRRAA